MVYKHFDNAVEGESALDTSKNSNGGSKFRLDPSKGMQWYDKIRIKKLERLIKILKKKEKEIPSDQQLYSKVDGLKIIYEDLLNFYHTHDSKFVKDLQKRLPKLDIDAINQRSQEIAPLIEQLEHMHSKLKQKDYKNESKKIIKMYHATDCGENFEVLNSFLKNGAVTHIASGYGQGYGFYMFRSLKRAYKHAQHFCLFKQPMILEFHEIITSEEWDLDYESSFHILIPYFIKYWDKIKIIPDDKIESTEGNYVNFSKSEGIIDPGLPGIMRYIRLKIYDKSKSSFSRLDLCANESGMQDAVVVANIFKYLYNHQNILNLDMEKQELKLFNQGVALKYLGKKPLRPKKIFFKIRNKWYNHETILRDNKFNLPRETKNLLKEI